MIHGISNNASAVHFHQNNVHQNNAAHKAASEESKVNAEERNESAAQERSEKANKISGSFIDKFA